MPSNKSILIFACQTHKNKHIMEENGRRPHRFLKTLLIIGLVLLAVSWFETGTSSNLSSLLGQRTMTKKQWQNNPPSRHHHTNGKRCEDKSTIYATRWNGSNKRFNNWKTPNLLQAPNKPLLQPWFPLRLQHNNLRLRYSRPRCPLTPMPSHWWIIRMIGCNPRHPSHSKIIQAV